MTSKKTWDFGIAEPLDKKRQALLQESRRHDLHGPLAEYTEHYRTHEALSNSADILAQAIESYCEGQVRALRKEGDVPEDEIDMLEEDLEHHVERVAVILVREAVKRLKK